MKTRKQYATKWNRKEADKALSLYLENKKTVGELAVDYDMSSVTFLSRLKKHPLFVARPGLKRGPKTAQPPAPCQHAERKATPVFSGVLAYFPKALREIARCSAAGNDQHNPTKPLHWDRSKSGDELDALARHLLDVGTMDKDGIPHSAKVAWRALANLEKELEASQ